MIKIKITEENEQEDDNLKDFPINRLGRALSGSNSQNPFKIIDENQKVSFSAQELVGVHDPVFMSYDIGERICLGTEEGLEIVAYYAGSNQTSVKFGEIRNPGHIHSERYPRDSILYTQRLEKSEKFKCTSLEQVTRLIDFLQANPRPIVEIAFGDKKKIIGYLGKSNEGTPDVAHSLSLKGEYDSWFRPAYVSPSELANPDKKLSLVRISSITLFKK